MVSEAQNRKLRVLANWGYYRDGWVAPFRRLEDEHGHSISYVYHLSEADEEGDAHPSATKLYWGEHPSAQSVLRLARPDVVVFMAVDGAWSISLNAAARRLGIPTVLLQHGVFDDLKNYLSADRTAAAVSNAKGVRAMKPSTGQPSAMRFLARSFGIENSGGAFATTAFMIGTRRFGFLRTARAMRFRARLPDRYLAYSSLNATIHRQLDGAGAGPIEVVGAPEFDAFFRAFGHENLREKVVPSESKAPYVLLIDSPNAGSRYSTGWVGTDDKAVWMRSLADQLYAAGFRLVVKLHPESYSASGLADADGIMFVRHHDDLASLITGARSVAGFESSILIPAIAKRPTVLFRVRSSLFVDRARLLGAATVFDGLCVDDGVIAALTRPVPPVPASVDQFLSDFVFKADGNAVSRLSEALVALASSRALSPEAAA